MARKISIPNFASPQEATKLYRRFAGVDFSTDETQIEDYRSPWAVNLIADEGGFPEKRVGWRTLWTFDGVVHGIFPYVAADDRVHYIVHAGTGVYRVIGSDKSLLKADVTAPGGRTAGFYMNGKLYLLTGSRYLVYNGTALTDVTENAYVPTTSISRAPTGGGTTYERANLLSRYRINKFTVAQTATRFLLDGLADTAYAPTITANGAAYTGTASWDGTDGQGHAYIKLSVSPEVTMSEADNLFIQYRVQGDESSKVTACQICATFGINSENRVFISGNDSYPNREWYSGLADPSYFPDLNYFQVGSDAFRIQCYLKAQGELMVIKEDNRQEGTIWVHSASLDSDGAATFPLKEGVSGYGAAARYSAATVMDDPMYVSPRGVLAPVTTYAYSYVQRSIKKRSGRVNPRLTKERTLADAIGAAWKGWYVLAVDGKAYVADTNQQKQDDGYEWYYWENIPAYVLCSHEQTLLFGTKDGRVCRFNDDMVSEGNDVLMRAYNDDGAAIPCEWATKLDTMNLPMRLKTMPKRGSGIHLKAYTRSTVDIYVRTDLDNGIFKREIYSDRLNWEDIDFKRFTFSTMQNTILPLQSKVKKWKAIQIILKSTALNEGFGVHAIAVRYIVGNYVKR